MTNYNKSKATIILIIIISLAIYLLIAGQKEVIIVGFVYKSDIINIVRSGQVITKVDRHCGRTKENLCDFYEKRKFYNFFSDMTFEVKIDSAGVIVLDTTIVIEKTNKRPILSFQDPIESLNHRALFVNDESDEKIVIP